MLKRRFTEEQKAYIATFVDRPGISNREVASSLRERFPGIIFTRRQVRNTRYKLRKAQLDGYTPFQATMKFLDEKGIHYKVLWSPEDQTKPLGLFWSPSWCAQEWKKNHRVQMYDNTYRTNNKGLALFQIVGMTPIGKAFSCAFGLISNERQEGFDWLLDQVDACRHEIGAAAPEITITDYDAAMKNAVQRVYPLATPQVCIFHVNKNVVLNVKHKWNKKAAETVRRDYVTAVAQAGTQTNQQQPPQSAQGSQPPTQSPQSDQLREEGLNDEEMAIVRRLNRIAIDPHHDGATPADPAVVEHSMAGLYELWAHVLYATTLDSFNTAWERLKAFFSEQTAIIKYLEDTYMTIAPQWATCYVNERRNYGQRTTSPVESVNRYIKSYVVNGNSTVLQVVEQSLKMVESMAEQIAEEVNNQQTTIRRKFIGKAWLGEAPYHVAIKALKKVQAQYRLMLPAIPTQAKPNPTPLPACTNKFTAQWGIPCSHRLLQKHHDKEALKKLDFDPF